MRRSSSHGGDIQWVGNKMERDSRQHLCVGKIPPNQCGAGDTILYFAYSICDFHGSESSPAIARILGGGCDSRYQLRRSMHSFMTQVHWLRFPFVEMLKVSSRRCFHAVDVIYWELWACPEILETSDGFSLNCFLLVLLPWGVNTKPSVSYSWIRGVSSFHFILWLQLYPC